MIRRFCDACTAEITEKNPNRVTRRLSGRVGRVMVEVHVGVDGVWNGDEVCDACVREAVAMTPKDGPDA